MESIKLIVKFIIITPQFITISSNFYNRGIIYMRDIDVNAVKAKDDKTYIEEFIKEYEFFIIQTANKTTGKFITKSDDQWSVSLSAFNEAIRTYSFEKGSFLSFAELVIKRRLYDYIKKQSKHFNEIAVSPNMFTSDSDEEDMPLKKEVLSKIAVKSDDEAKLEIEALSCTLNENGFSFFDLVSVSPKAAKTKTACAKAIAYISQNALLLNEMRNSKNLPIKIIEKNLCLPRKILERHRKYIIAGIEIISGNYPILAEYLKFVREELSK